MRILLICFLFLGLTIKGYAQDNSASGILMNSMTGDKVMNARITVYALDSITGRFLSDNLGTFKIPISLLLSCTHLKIEIPEYEKFVYPKQAFINDLKRKHPGLGLLKLIPKGINLKEVVIKKGRKYRDTLIIDLSNEHFDRSYMINDLLSGEKGFFRNADGKLFFKGKEVADIVLNGGNFFGKNNLDIYKYLPSLTLDNIEITETNIDSITNTVILKPRIKINLKLKDEFKKGKFGSANLGYGSADRYLLASDLYKYKNNEQISLVINSNNINSGDNPYVEPNVNFSSNGNNTTSKSAKLGYRNIFYKNKIEVEAAVKGKLDNRKFSSEMLRQDEIINLFSKTSNVSSLESLGLESANLNVNYRIDSLSAINFRQSASYNKIDQKDSLSYEIRSANQNMLSRVNKIRSASTFSFSNAIQYEKRFANNRGRSIHVNFSSDFNKYNRHENNNIFGVNNLIPNNYFINGNRVASQRALVFAMGGIEPLGDSGYLNFFINYKDERFWYDANSLSDSIPGYNHDLSVLNNRYLQPGIKFQKTFRKVAVDGELINILNFRKIEKDFKTNDQTLFNININAFIEYKINKKNNLSGRYTTRMNYPNITQLTPINNSFDLVSQMKGNLYLKPEMGNRAEVIYSLRKTDSLIYTITGAADFYKSKFGFNINNQPGSYQISYVDNIGSSNSYEFTFLLYKIFRKGNSLNYRLSVNRIESPVITSEKSILNDGININQSFSSSFSIFSYLNISPMLSTIFSEYQYDTNKSRMYGLTYSDKFSLTIPKVCTLNLYPLVNYAYNINSSLTWAINGEIKRDFFKKYGTIWIKAYDLFNSFSYTNNYLGTSYSQSTKYSNLSRYVLAGVSFKFNTMK